MFMPLRQEISQGDIFDSIPFPVIRFAEGQAEVSLREFRAMLLTYDCEYDKSNVPVALMAQVRVLGDMPAGAQGNIRDNKVVRCFPLSALESVFNESFVELGNVASVPKTLLEEWSRQNRRIASLDDNHRVHLQGRLGAFLGLGREQQ